MKKNTLILIINAVLVVMIALVFGITFRDRFQLPLYTLSYVMLLLTLCLPSLLIIADKSLGIGADVLVVLLFACGVTLNALGIINYSSWDFNTMIIIHGSLVGASLLVLMGIIAISKKD